MAFGAITENTCYRIPAGQSVKTAAGVKFEHVEAGHYIFHGRENPAGNWEKQSQELTQRIAEARAFLSSKGAASHAG